MSKKRKKGIKKGKAKKGGQRSLKRRTWMPAGAEFRDPYDHSDHLQIRVSKDLQWVLPYLERTHKMLPRLQMPIAINSYKPSLSRRLRTLGTSYYDEGVINIATHQQVFERSNGEKIIKGIRRIPRRKILETLAHELAHFHVVEHNFEHAEMTVTIFRTFGLKPNALNAVAAAASKPTATLTKKLT